MSQRGDPHWIWIVVLSVGATGIVVGLALVASTAGSLRAAFSDQALSTSPGRVMSARVHVHDRSVFATTRHRQPDGTRARPEVRSVTSYQPVIGYEYEVGGKRYESTVLADGQMEGTRAWAEDVVERFPEGAEVSVHYDPDDPARSVLLLNLRSQIETKLVAGGAACGVGFVLSIVGYLMVRRRGNRIDTPESPHL